MFLLVPAHPGFPGQIPQSRKTVVCVCVCDWQKYLACTVIFGVWHSDFLAVGPNDIGEDLIFP